MSPEQYQRLLSRLSRVRNTDELLDLELTFAPLDEEEPLVQRALFELACRRCHLARGPALAQARFTLHRAAPAGARQRFELRGRMGTRIVRIGWADGRLYGSLYAIARVERELAGMTDAATAARILRSHLAVLVEPARAAAVA